MVEDVCSAGQNQREIGDDNPRLPGRMGVSPACVCVCMCMCVSRPLSKVQNNHCM